MLQYKHNVERDTISLLEASSLVRHSRKCSGESSPDEKPLDDVKSPILADVVCIIITIEIRLDLGLTRESLRKWEPDMRRSYGDNPRRLSE
ncbi:hypothetical protein RYX36_022511 [Vicia faba]